MSQPRIFVSHSSKDTTFAQRLAADLRRAGADAWIYEADESAGNIMERVDEMLAQCEWLVLVLSPDALASSYVRMEVFVGLNRVHQGRMRGVVPLVARAIDPDALPPTWAALRRFDATGNEYAAGARGVLVALGLPTSGLDNKPAAQPTSPAALPSQPTPPPAQPAPDVLPARLAQRGFVARRSGTVEYIVPPLCEVPAGEFLMGSDPRQDREADDDEQPQHRVSLPVFQVARYPVTVAEYACFVRAGQQAPSGWKDQLKWLDHPVVNVSWHHAVAHAAWVAELTGKPWRLPTEAEWEKAARGSDGCRYPWGNQWDPSRANTLEEGPGTTTPVGAYADCGDASPYSVHDLIGNVWEWTSSLFKPYPYNSGDGRERTEPSGSRVLRGGSLYVRTRIARLAYRLLNDPDNFNGSTGARLVCTAPGS